VQIALAACGISCPRDSDMQEQALGTPVAAAAAADFSDLQRGDLVFWKSHVAMVRGDGNLLHAKCLSHGGCHRADRRRDRAQPQSGQRSHQRKTARALVLPALAKGDSLGKSRPRVR